MGGMKFEYDENGGKFYYFLLSFYGLILLPTTYWLWPKPEQKKSTPHPEDTSNFDPCHTKSKLLYTNEPKKKRRARITKSACVIAWIILLILVYRVSFIEVEHKEYDPFAVLDIDQEASVSDIKRAYRELSKVHHPDRGGDPERFKAIAKAYKALTDEEARKNWKEYGNPDGPGVTHFGIALPKWLVDHQNSLFVLLIYTGIFMIVLPVIICIWWQKSARYGGDDILPDTARIYCAFLNKSSSIISIKRLIMIMSASLEFARTHNPVIIDRPSDNIEIPKLIKSFPDVREKTKEGPLQFPYSIKARTLIYAHLHRYDRLSDDLDKDKQYIIKRLVYLITEIINIQAELIYLGHNKQLKHILRLETIENTMKLSVMIVQAFMNIKSPLLQLPHLTEENLKFFETKKRTIRSIQQFAAMDDQQRRSMLRSLTDEQYHDIINVLSIYPHVTMNVSYRISDDENESEITAGAVVTLTVHLHRENMSLIFSHKSVVEEQIDDKEKTNEITKTWNNKSDKKKKSNKDKGKKKGRSTSAKTNPPKQSQITTTTTTAEINNKESSDDDDDDSSKHSHDSPRHKKLTKEDLNESENEVNDEINNNNQTNEEDEDLFLEKFQQQQRKKEKLETKEKISHRVFCPFYPEIKQECWWLYVADVKRNLLISAPIYLCTLKDDEEVEVKFMAPKTSGHYDYSVILKCDSYFGVDVINKLPLDVKAAKVVEDNHPQWDFEDGDNGEINNTNNQDEEYATESDTDNN